LVDDSHGSATEFAENFVFADSLQREAPRRTARIFGARTICTERPLVAANVERRDPWPQPGDSPTIIEVVLSCERERYPPFSQA
jgi:hypothetical protein